MKRKITTFFITVSLLLSLTSWRAFTSRAASGHTGAGQQVGEPFRVPAIAAGYSHSLALKSDGSVLVWGRNNEGQTTVPSAAQSGVTVIAAGYLHSLALKSDGSVIAWGDNLAGQATVPSTAQSGVTTIAAGGYHSLALSVVNNTAPTINAMAVTRTAGSPASSSQMATVSDAQDQENTLSVTATLATGSGVTVTGISAGSSGNVTANVAAACAATTSTFTLQVTDSGGSSAQATLTVTVNATPPTLSYPNNPGTQYGTAITVSPLSGPSDDVAVNSVRVHSITPSNPGGITVNSAGVVSVANNVPAGTYTVTIRATDNCGGANGTTDASFTLGIVRATYRHGQQCLAQSGRSQSAFLRHSHRRTQQRRHHRQLQHYRDTRQCARYVSHHGHAQ